MELDSRLKNRSKQFFSEFCACANCVLTLSRRQVKRLLSMRKHLRYLPAIGYLFVLSALADEEPSSCSPQAVRNWPQWRGPLANGVAPHANPPVHWSENEQHPLENPAAGQRAFHAHRLWRSRFPHCRRARRRSARSRSMTTRPAPTTTWPVTHRHQFVVLAVSRRNGEILWKKVLREEFPHEGGHETGSLASNSPVTDGERRLRLLRFARPLLPRPERRVEMAEGPRPDANPPCPRRRQFARASRRHADRLLGS